MSIGVLLVCVELIMMLIILVFMPRDVAGASFIGFAIGESLGAKRAAYLRRYLHQDSRHRFGPHEDCLYHQRGRPEKPGVIADCTGDNAGDSVGPTADGFETYGVTGVALISFIVLAAFPQYQAELLVWIFVMRISDDHHLHRLLLYQRGRLDSDHGG